MAPSNAPPVDRQKKKKRELELGFANNAFGAGAGAVATKMALAHAKNIDPDSLAQKPTVEPPKPTMSGKLINRTKLPKKVKVGLVGGALVGSQLANAAMDAQSGYYFGRERAKLQKKPKPVAKSEQVGLAKAYDGPQRGSGIGQNLIEKKANFGEEREMRRQRNVGRGEVLGYGGAAAAGAGGARMVHGELIPGGKGNVYLGVRGAARKSGAKGIKAINPKFAGGAALLAAAPALAYGTRRMSQSGKETWR